MKMGRGPFQNGNFLPGKSISRQREKSGTVTFPSEKYSSYSTDQTKALCSFLTLCWGLNMLNIVRGANIKIISNPPKIVRCFILFFYFFLNSKPPSPKVRIKIENRNLNINPRLTKGRGWLPSPRDFFLSPKNQKESDPSHQCDLFDVLRSHFDEKNWGYHLTRG